MLTLLIVLLASGVLLVIAAATVMAVALLRPPRMTDGKAIRRLRRIDPSDLGLPFESQTFTVRDVATDRPLRLAAWWIPHPAASGRTVILLHGYADAKVGAIAWAPLLHACEQNILALDLRAHGESEGNTISAGHFERHDVSDVIDLLRAARPADVRQVVLMGISLGCATATAVAEMRADVIAGLILDSPYASFYHATAMHGHLLGLPGGVAQRLSLWIACKISGAPLDRIRPIDLVRTTACPAMILRGTGDPFLSAEELRDLPGHVHVESFDGAEHLLAMSTHTEQYAGAVARFLLRSVSAEARTAR
jgi:uncharacterized protein